MGSLVHVRLCSTTTRLGKVPNCVDGHWVLTADVTGSLGCAAVFDMRRAAHEGQSPLCFLQMKATACHAPFAAAQPRKPCARMPQSRKALNSPLMNRGSADPVLASVCAVKLGLLHQPVQRGLLGAMALVADPGHPAPAGLPADGLHARLPRL